MAVFFAQPAEQVVKRQPQANLERRVWVACINGQQERDGFHQVRRHTGEQPALAARLAHELEFVLLEVAQPAMNQFRGPAGGAGGEIARLDQSDFHPRQRRLARDRSAIHAAADDSEIKLCFRKRRGFAVHEFGYPPAKVSTPYP